MEAALRIGISGSSGMLGQLLSRRLNDEGMQVIPISRALLYGDAALLAAALEGLQIIIHLAGAPIFGSWSASGKAKILNSRLIPTTNLATAISLMNQKPLLVISASAVGIYSEKPRQSEMQYEYAQDFPGQVCREWENAASAINNYSRCVVFRLGIVLDDRGGALHRMLAAFRLGLGGPIASGQQMFSWVHKEDVVGAVIHAIQNPMTGVFNLCAPEVVSNAEFSRTLAKTLHRPCWLRIPAFALYMLYGKAASMLIGGQDVIPKRLQEADFNFRFPALRMALSDLLP